MIERFLPVSAHSEQDVAQHLHERGRGNGAEPYFSEGMLLSTHDFSPTQAAARSAFMSSYSPVESRFWSHKHMFWNDRPLKGSEVTLPARSLVVVQKLVTPRDLGAEQMYGYVGIIPRRKALAEVIGYTDNIERSQLATRGLWDYLNNQPREAITADYKQQAQQLEADISTRYREYHHEKAKRLVTSDFLERLPTTVAELTEVCSGLESAVNFSHKPEEKEAAKNFKAALEYLGVPGMPEGTREWYEKMYSSGVWYVKQHDEITQQRLDSIHADRSNVLEAIQQNGQLFTLREYTQLEPGRPYY